MRCPIRAAKAIKRLGRIQILMKVVRLTTVKAVKEGRGGLVGALKRKVAISTQVLNSRRQAVIEKLSKMNLAGLTRTVALTPVATTIRLNHLAKNIGNRTAQNK